MIHMLSMSIVAVKTKKNIISIKMYPTNAMHFFGVCRPFMTHFSKDYELRMAGHKVTSFL